MQDERNIINGLGEIMKLALVRSTELFSLLELHGPRLVRERFQVRRSPITAVKVLPSSVRSVHPRVFSSAGPPR